LNELNIFFNIFKSQIEKKKNEKGSELAAMVPMYAKHIVAILDIRSTSEKCIFVYYLNTRKTTVCIISYINVLF
jgi:hypothetical protein